MSALPPPNWLRTFEAAARLGGFTAAGDELGLTPAAVSQQIRALETRLGFHLFDRHPRGVALNAMGRAYLLPVRRAFEDLETATAGLFWGAEPTAVSVRAPISFAALRLTPALARFRERHATTAIRLCTDLWAEAADDSTVDLDIRYGDGRWQGAEVVPLSAPVSTLVCPPGTPVPQDVPGFLGDQAQRAIHVTGYEGLWAALFRKHDVPGIAGGSGLAADSSLVALEMVASGLGSALIARELAQQHLANGRVMAPGFEVEHASAHYLVRPHRPQAPSAGTLLFRDWLVRHSGLAPGR